MLRIIAPREWITHEFKKLVELAERTTLSNEEKVILIKAQAQKTITSLEDPMFYKGDLK